LSAQSHVSRSRKNMNFEHLFDQLDADRDGAISLAEVEKKGWAKTRFETGDEDADGRLDRAEFDALKS